MEPLLKVSNERTRQVRIREDTHADLSDPRLHLETARAQT
jgi:hypothetical protein